MRKILFFLISLLPTLLFAQTIGQDGDMEVPEDTSYHCSTINVTGVGILSDIHGLEKVCMIIESDDDGDLSIALVDPNGNVYYLSTNNGGDGDDYGSSGWGSDSTCFTMNASTDITAGSPPFEGDFIPEDDISLANNLQSGDGVWRLCLMDNNDNGSDVKLDEWSLTFSDNPPNHITRITHDCNSSSDEYFYDLGGENGDYTPGEIHYWVICPNDTNLDIGLQFEEWDVEDSSLDDHLTFWNDTDATGQIYMDAGDVEGASLDGILMRADNPTGCLTLRWISDGDTLVGSGWKAKMECYTSCQLVNFEWDARDSNNEDTNYIAVCQGQEVVFKAHGVYPENDDHYHQDDATSTFRWDFGDGHYAEGSYVTHVYDTAKGYQVKLVVTDKMGCPSHLSLDKRVIVSLTPTFTGTKPEADNICANTCTHLIGKTQMYAWKDTIEPPTVDTTVLPDGNGVYYYSQIDFQTFRLGDTISDGSQIDSMMMNIEHSYVGDIVVWLICPNGTEVQLFDGNDYNNGAGDFLGKPGSDDGNPDFPGIGWTYSFSDNATTLFEDAPEVPDTTVDGTTHDGVKPGTYKPVDSFDNFIGCPLNGKWILKINDDQSADDGYLFSWWIDFADSLYYNGWGYHMEQVDSLWTGDKVENGDNGDLAQACPVHTGENKFTYTITDQFGCKYDTTIIINAHGVEITAMDSTPVKCHGGSDGSATVKIEENGSASSFDYVWTGPDGYSNTTSGTTDKTNTINGLSAGVYRDSVTDDGGCWDTATIVVTEPPALTLTIDKTDEVCVDENNGTATAHAGGGTPGYSYSWDNDGTTDGFTDDSTATNLADGTYHVTVKDDNGCTIEDDVTIDPGEDIIADFDPPANQCLEGNDFTFDITSNSTTGSGVTYHWDFGDGNTGSGTPKHHTYGSDGTYEVTLLIQHNTCKDSAKHNVTVNPHPVLTFADTARPLCHGDCNGEAKIEADGGGNASDYNYSWDDAANSTTDAVNDLCANTTYHVTVENKNTSCKSDTSIRFTEPNELLIDTDVVYVKCNGGNDGSVTVYITQESTPDYDYKLYDDVDGSNGYGSVIDSKMNTTDLSHTFSGLSAGNYSVEVEDNNGCNKILNVTIKEPDALVITSLTHEDAHCGQHDGSIDLEVSGGTPSYTYEWDIDGTGDNDDAQDTTNIPAGTYHVTVTDAHACTITSSVTIDDIAGPTVKLKNIHDPKCHDGSDGGATAFLEPPSTGDYIYHWDNEGTTTDITSSDTSNSISTFKAGDFAVTVTDKYGCTTTASGTLNNPTQITISVDDTAYEHCNQKDGLIKITPSGGTTASGNYSYDWDPNSGSGNAVDGQEDQSGLMGTTYTVTVTDDSGCTATETIALKNMAGPEIQIASQKDPLCHGDGNGIATVEITTTTTPDYTYEWDNPSNSTTTTSNTSNTVNDLKGGVTYHVTVTDDYGCSATTSVTLNDPTQVTVSLTKTDVTCNRAKDGTIKADGNGGTGIYDFDWSPDGENDTRVTSSTITNKDTGMYVVTVTDTNGCVVKDSIHISEPDAIVITPSHTDATCGRHDGSASVSVSGGTVAGDYGYQWYNPAEMTDSTDSDIDSIPTGNYKVIVTDDNGCKDSVTIAIADIGGPTIAMTDSANPSCYGYSDGWVKTEITTTSDAPYDYEFSNGVTVNDTDGLEKVVTGLTSGVISVTVTDDKGCKATASKTLYDPDSMHVNIKVYDAHCYQADGSIDITPSGGTVSGDYSYTWSPSPAVSGQQDQDSNLTPNTYTVTVEDDHHCTYVISGTVGNIDGPTVEITDITNPSCTGFADGTATATITTTSTDPYDFRWSNGDSTIATAATTDVADSLQAGITYHVTVTDKFGCTSTDDTTLVDPAPLVIVLDSTHDAHCGQADGGIYITPQGGTVSGDYSYTWSPSPAVSGQQDQDNNLTGQSYTVRVKDDNGCVLDSTFTIPDVAGPVVDITDQTDPLCHGDKNGKATATIVTPSADGSDGPYAGDYTYKWSDPAGRTISTTSLTDSVIDLYGDVMYYVTVTDEYGCKSIDSVQLTDPAQLTATIIYGKALRCYEENDGIAEVQGNGGVHAGDYKYLWDDSAATTTARVTGLHADITYHVTVTDDNGCTAVADTSLTQPDSIKIVVQNIVTDKCSQGKGEIDLNVTGGSLNSGNDYGYDWNPDGGSGNAVDGQLDQTHLLGGVTYNLTVTDDSSCTNTLSVYVDNEGSPVVVIDSTVDPSCHGYGDGYAHATITTTTHAPYTYDWINSDGDTVAHTNAKDELTDEKMIFYGDSTYTIMITDNEGCRASANFTLNDPDSVVATISYIKNVSCNGGNDGEIAVSVTGGTGIYTYRWDDGNAQTTDTAVNLTAGHYSVTVKDEHQCSDTASGTITEPTPVTVSTDGTDEYCTASDGSVWAHGSGGTTTTPYTYTWQNEAGTWSTDSTDSVLTNLPAGKYLVTVYDANGCSATGSKTINDHPGQTISISDTTHVSCYGYHDGDATVSITGGEAPYTINWSYDGDTSTKYTADSLSAGTYTVTVLDKNACVDSVSVTIRQPDLFTVSLNNVLLKCHGDCNAKFTAHVTGGTRAYTFEWSATPSGNVSPADNDSILENRCAGEYRVKVTDANGCVARDTGVAMEPAPIVLTADTVSSSCGRSDGAVIVDTVTGGNGNYTYQWTDNDTVNRTTQDLIDVPAGNYFYTITDSKGCHLDTSFQINDEGAPVAVIDSIHDVTCYQQHDGAIRVQVTGGHGGNTFAWGNDATGDTVATTQTATNLDGGDYTVTVTDQDGCKASATGTIFEPTQLSFVLTTVDNKCNGDCEGIATVTPYGGLPPYTYSWSGGGNNPNDSSNTGLCAGNYTIQIKDSNQCDTIYNGVVITEPPVLKVDSTSHKDVKCFGGNTGEASVYVSGGTPPYSYAWDDPAHQTTATASNLKKGTYSVTIVDDNDCQTTASVTIDEPDKLVFNNVWKKDLRCHDIIDGKVRAGASGGTPDYSYHWTYSEDASFSSSASEMDDLDSGTYYLTITDANACTIDTFLTLNKPSALVLTLSPEDESCAGVCDGKVNTGISGGTPHSDGSYDYNWDNADHTYSSSERNITDLCPNTYYLTVTDDSNCTINSSATVNGPDPLAITVTIHEDASCGRNDGHLKIEVAGGTGSPSVTWSNGVTGLDNPDIAFGNYTVTVEDENHCTKDTSIAISNTEGPIIKGINVYDVSCYGGNDGALKVDTASPDTAAHPYTVTWSTGASSDSIYGLTAGTYSVTVTDTNGCTVIDNATISEPDSITINVRYVTDATCYGRCNGNAEVYVGGGTAPYSYAWSTSPTQTTARADSLCAGDYTVTVTDTNGCWKTKTITVEEPQALTITLISIDSVSCPGDNDGSITIQAGGGSGSYTYTWYGQSSTSNTAGGLAVGTYTVEVADQSDNTCSIDSSFTVYGPTPISVEVGSYPTTCNKNNGTAFITSISGGTPPYHWTWPGCSSDCNGDTVYNLAPDVYTLQVFDKHNCSTTVDDTVGALDAVLITEVVTTDVNCYEGSDGTAIVHSNGEAGPPYSYTWTPYGGPDSVTTNLIAGTYTVTIEDTNHCTDFKVFSIDQPNPLHVQLDGPSSPICIGQYAQLSAAGAGGTPPYTYVWSHDTSLHSQNISVQPSVTTTYRVQAKDANGCLSPYATFTVTVYPRLHVSVTSPQDICEGQKATLTAVASGGNGGPYTYVWNIGSGNPNIVAPTTTTSYQVNVYDNCGTPSDSATTAVYVHRLPVLLSIDSAAGCEPLTVTFKPQIFYDTSENRPTYEWLFYDQIGSGGSSNDTMPTHEYMNDGIYDVELILTSEYGCKSDTVVKELVTVYPVPNSSFTMDPQAAGVFDAEIQFFDNSEPDVVQWYWSFGDSSYSLMQNPIHTYENAGTYEVQLIVGTSHQCYDTSSVIMRVKPEHTFYPPTAFSPGTGYSNNYWYPKGIGIDGKNYHLWIYDRWGQVIYETDVKPAGTESVVEVEGGWNGRYQNTGKPVPPDTYVWLVILKDVNGEEHHYSGTVTVVK